MTYYVKSLDSDYTTKTLVGEEKIICQTLQEIIDTKIIKPNTKSFAQELRLSTTILHDNYTKTYRPQGIIFTSNEKPEYILPFDLILLAQSEKILVHYYKMKNNLHQFYNHPLIPGYKNFIFTDIEKLLKDFPSPEEAWKEMNKFRVEHGQKELPISKFRLCTYNEAVFVKPLSIAPIAIFGYESSIQEIAKNNNLPYFKTAVDFWKKASSLQVP